MQNPSDKRKLKTFFFSKLMRNFTLNGWRLAVVVAVYIHLAIFIFRVYNSITYVDCLIGLDIINVSYIFNIERLFP